MLQLPSLTPQRNLVNVLILLVVSGEPILLDTMQTVRHGLYPNITQMAIMISACPKRVFFGAKHTLAPERIVRLGAEMTECLKSWVKITPGRQRAHVTDTPLLS